MSALLVIKSVNRFFCGMCQSTGYGFYILPVLPVLNLT